jgi:hypothetical protein
MPTRDQVALEVLKALVGKNSGISTRYLVDEAFMFADEFLRQSNAPRAEDLKQLVAGLKEKTDV